MIPKNRVTKIRPVKLVKEVEVPTPTSPAVISTKAETMVFSVAGLRNDFGPVDVAASPGDWRGGLWAFEAGILKGRTNWRAIWP